jgi:hypothetical protein
MQPLKQTRTNCVFAGTTTTTYQSLQQHASFASITISVHDAHMTKQRNQAPDVEGETAILWFTRNNDLFGFRSETGRVRAGPAISQCKHLGNKRVVILTGRVARNMITLFVHLRHILDLALASESCSPVWRLMTVISLGKQTEHSWRVREVHL